MLQAIALQSAKIIGITKLAPQIFKNLPIIVLAIGTKFLDQMLPEMHFDMIVIQQRVIDIEEKDDPATV